MVVMIKKPFERFTRFEFNDDDGKEKHYVFDKYIFLTAVCVLVLTMLALIFSNGGFNAKYNFYVVCNNTFGGQTYFINGTIQTGNTCENPLFQNKYCSYAWAGACEQETLPNGFKYGEPPPKFINYFQYATFLIMILALGINHFVHNRGGKR